MIKQALAELGLAPFAVAGLLVFFAVFCAIGLWTLTRSRRQVAVWSSLPLADGAAPVEPRLPIEIVNKPSDAPCGQCEDCSCEKPANPTK